jgi:hypothetical protein
MVSVSAKKGEKIHAFVPLTYLEEKLIMLVLRW